jgi:hypothetical protein
MLPLFLPLSLSSWQTSHLGRPILSRLRGPNLLVYTRDNIVALLNSTSGRSSWRQSITGIAALDIVDDIAVLASSRYFYVIDGVTGLLLNITKHDLLDVNQITITNQSIALFDGKSLHLYDRSQLQWKRNVESGDNGLEFTDSGLAYGGKEYELSDGSVKGEYSIAKVEKVEFVWEPTVLLAERNGSLLWRFDDPLYNATLLTAVTKSQFLLTNATNYFVYDVMKEKIVVLGVGNLLAFAPQADAIFVETESGVVKLDRKTKAVSPYDGVRFSVSQNGVVVNVSNRTFAFTRGCVEKCSAASQYGGVLSVAACGHKLVATVLDLQGHVRNLVHSEHGSIGTCWDYDDALALSYYDQKKKIAYVTSFGLTNVSQRTYTTESLILAAGRDKFALANGRIAEIDGVTFHPAAGTAGSWAGPASPDVKGKLRQGAFPGVKTIVDTYGCLAVQNYDIHVLEGAGDDTYATMHIAITGAAVFISLALFVNAQKSKKTSFWE